MKKITALLLALIMLLSLCACGAKKPELLGRYENELDVTAAVIFPIDDAIGFTEVEGYSVADYLPEKKLSFKMVSEFNEDGTYATYIDTASCEKAMEDVKAAIIASLESYMFDTYKKMINETGLVSIETKEDVAAFIGLSWDELVREGFGGDPEVFAGEMVPDAASMVEASYIEGNYKAKDGKLYCSEGLENTYDPEIYETYEINGDMVTVTGGVGGEYEEELYSIYPYEMIKVSD